MEELIQRLAKLQANVFCMYAQSHGYHWNVEGVLFKELHAFFKEIYEDVFESIDEISENIRKLDGYAPFGALAWANNCSIVINDDLQLSPIQMLKELEKTNDQVIATYKDAYNLAEIKFKEHALSNYLAGRLDQHMFWAWQIKSSLKSAVM